jgi:hypothetical protein
MIDVARLANVSLKTVSRVVNGEPHVRRETEQRVRLAISELGSGATTQLARCGSDTGRARSFSSSGTSATLSRHERGTGLGLGHRRCDRGGARRRGHGRRPAGRRRRRPYQHPCRGSAGQGGFRNDGYQVVVGIALQRRLARKISYSGFA